MSKTWDTKKKILGLLSSKKLTLTDISKNLGLAPSTVNQHIKELLAMGAIHQVYNPFILKWKYYEKDPNFDQDVMYDRQRMPMQRLTDSTMFRATAAILAIIVISGLAIFALGNHTMKFPNGPSVVNGTSGGAATTVTSAALAPPNSTVFSISDSPLANASTITAVNVTVSNMSVHSASTGKWYAVLDSPETFNLVALNNISQLISAANLSSGTYDEVKLEVSSVSAVMNGSASNVFLPSGNIMIFGKFNVSGDTTSWVNLDVSLQKSLHLTGNGELVMLPVINMHQSSNAIIRVNGTGMLEVENHGKEHLNTTVGMGLNGSIGEGAQVPEGVEIDLEHNGDARNELVINKTSSGIRIEHNGDAITVSQNGSEHGAGHVNINVTEGSGGDGMSNQSNGNDRGRVNVTAGSNSTISSNVIAGYATCNATEQCVKVPTTYCHNGLPQQSVCINSQHLAQYMSYFNSTVSPTVCPEVSPSYIMAIQTACECVSSECTLIIISPSKTDVG